MILKLYYGNANLITQTRKPRYIQNIAYKNLQTDYVINAGPAIILECLRYSKRYKAKSILPMTLSCRDTY